MAISITEIVNSTNELAAFPLTGDVAFFISESIDNIEQKVRVVKKDTTAPNLASFLYTQLGRSTEDYIPDYNVELNTVTKKVTVHLRSLIPLENYVILFNTLDGEGTLSESTTSGLGSVSVSNYRTGPQEVLSLKLTALSDSEYISDSFRTTFGVQVNSEPALSKIIDHSSPYEYYGINIVLSSDPFISGDYFHFTFPAVSDNELFLIDLKTTNIESLAQTISAETKRVNELDLIAFYEEQNVPVSPTQPDKIKRILKSSTSMIVEFTEPVDLNTLNVSCLSGPAFNMLSIPEGDWNQAFRIEVKKISPTTLYFKFMDSTSSSNEVVKNV